MKPPTLPNVPKLELDGFALDVTYYVQKEYVDIAEAAIELPSIIEWLNYQSQLNNEAKMLTKAKLERVEAKVFFDLKDGEYQRLGYGDKPSIDALNRAVALNEEVIALKDDLAVYDALVDRLRNLQRSLMAKLDLVRSSEATRRRLVE